MTRALAQERIAPGEFIVDWALATLTDADAPIELYGDAFLDHKRMIGDNNGNRID